MTGEAAKHIEDRKFIDNAEMAVDDKLRLGIPERCMKVLKTVAPEHQDKLGAMPMPDHSLKLLPYPLFVERMAYWESLDDRISEERTIRSFILKLAKVHPLDPQNRIRLTPLQAKFCEIGRKAIVVGDIDSMLVYDPDVYDRTLLTDLENFSMASDVVTRAKKAQ